MSTPIFFNVSLDLNNVVLYCNTMTTATVSPNEISVRHTVRPDVNREFLTFDIPNGWDDVQKICKKVLVYEGRKFVFSCWNSDRMDCHFYRFIDGNTPVAKWE